MLGDTTIDRSRNENIGRIAQVGEFVDKAEEPKWSLFSVIKY